MTGWTPEQDAELRANFDAGLPLSYAEMAEVLNGKFGTSYTRNAAIGRGHRLGLTKIRPNSVPKTGPKRAVTPAQRPDIAIRKAVALPTIPAPFVPRLVEVHTENVPLLDLTPNGCRWPSGDGEFVFCNLPQEPCMPYCPDHCALAYRAPEARRRSA